jgi:predicted ferric reductase
MLLIIYFIVNGLGLGLGIREASDLATLATRAGALAMVNLIPLFLGGRTNTLSNFLNVPLQTYYLIHHWVGRMAVLQALLHVGIIVRLEGLPRTSSNTVSGALVSESRW